MVLERLLPVRGRRKVFGPGQHAVRKENISQAALDIIARLQSEGHETYLVGGAVRDLLLDLVPKDFDIGTAATPEQVTALFRRARVIGRRFPIVHVRAGREVVEVTTFRGHTEESYGEITIGTAKEDAERRDITINGLLYDPSEDTIFDYVGGVADLQKKRVRVIGRPVERFEEDPVRIVRCHRMAGRLGFDLDPSILKSEAKTRQGLLQVSRGRLTLEKEKDFVGELRSSAIHTYRDGACAPFLDQDLQKTLQAVPDENFALYDQYCEGLRAFPKADDRKQVMRVILLGALVWPDAFGEHTGEERWYIDDVRAALDPILAHLEIARWKRPIVVRALYGQRELDRQLDAGNLSSRHLGKDFYLQALGLAQLRGRQHNWPSKRDSLLRKQIRAHIEVLKEQGDGRRSTGQKPRSRSGRRRPRKRHNRVQ